ncbi:MAG: VCBS repeat-containing protein [Acidobacteria bacterium]|nr:VCBS repeat-containing protein [Acidobacteriota bacterium]
MIHDRSQIYRVCAGFACISMLIARPLGGDEVPRANSDASPWLMFHRDENHTGVAVGSGNIDPASGPIVHWTFRVTTKPSKTQFCSYRWYSSFPLGDLDGDGALEVVVTTPDNFPDSPDRIIALKDMGGQSPGVTELWTYTVPPPEHGLSEGVDQYSAALADADSDGLLDILFCSKDGYVRALKGTTGQLIWEYKTGRYIEAGPMIADLDGDGALEAIVPTDCKLGAVDCPGSSGTGALYVFRVAPAGGQKSNPPIWWRNFPGKLDSAEPAVADLDSNDGRNIKALVMGSWAGRLYVVWRNPDGKVIIRSITLDKLDPSIHSIESAVVRSSPLAWKFGGVWRAVFGWMPDKGDGRNGRISAVDIVANMKTGAVTFTPKWTISRADWKSSVALLPQSTPPLVVTGYGIGIPANQGTGNYGLCCNPMLGGILAIDSTGSVVWEKQFEKDGNIRSSTAVGDVDGDGHLEVILTGGCSGKIYAFDGATGAQEWSRQLGPRTIGTPSIGDLDGDGTTEIVVCSYDGRVYALGGPRAGQTGDDPAVWEPGSAAPSDGDCDCDQFRTPACGEE